MSDLAETPQLDELYKLYGIAAHNCCNIEYRIVYLLLGPKWRQTEGLTPEKVSEVYDKLQSQSLGSLLKEYKQHFAFTDEQLELMKDVLEKRNYLTHRFFGTHGKKMHDLETQKQMIAELKGLIHVFQTVSRALNPETCK